ncbi:hypothetical protein V6N13_070066 [Hibiscus sabdariffa]
MVLPSIKANIDTGNSILVFRLRSRLDKNRENIHGRDGGSHRAIQKELDIQGKPIAKLLRELQHLLFMFA